ncbi:PE family protein [Mycobacterium paragordonae]|uniref:PE family protein n=1 Tax=Mycobacterium paragordonae TaxID=1389713 RepID=A0ABQ1CEN4_9MYCO|nr:PE-PPE domain-containing protein [Mycobacterium paragordonae]AYE93766.1 PE family protein [Mycobacterium paragordonae]GFG82711.1 hypothetical protein MPRG_59870 [Mycobacterium paragordonae]
MSYLTTQPQLMSAAAENLAGIRTALAEASAAAAGPTTGLAAAAADEISAAAAQLFGTFGQEYQQVIGQAAAFHAEFNRALTAAGLTYAEAEIANAAQVLGGGGALSAAASPIEALLAPVLAPLQPLLAPVQPLLAPLQSLFGVSGTGAPLVNATITPQGAYNSALIMSGSGTAIPTQAYMNAVRPWINAGFNVGALNIPLNTPEGLYPLTQIKDLPLNQSVATGVQILDNALFGPGTGLITPLGQKVSVLGLSQSAIISSLELRNLIALGSPHTADLSFTLLGSQMVPNGGLLARFPGLSLPALGLDFYGATPANSGYPVNTFTLQYDGYADFPRYPLNILSDLNAFLGIQSVHGNYDNLNINALPPGYNLVELSVSPTTAANGLDHYYMITHPDLPLLSPIKSIPVIGAPLAALLKPNLTYLVNWGYGDPHFGYSTGYADVPTPFEVLPPIPPNFIGDQIALAGQGFNDFRAAIGTPALPSAASLTDLLPVGGGTGGLSLPFGLPGATTSPVNSFFDALKAANTNFTTAITSAAADTYAVALPTADIFNTLVTTVPSYDVNLFLDGIQQTLNGDPTGGLINAFGKPLAANVAIGSLAGGFELILVAGAISDVIGDFTGAA